MKRIGGKVLDGLMGRFQGFTKKISEKLSALLRKPEVEEKAKEPVKESILEQLRKSREQADANNEARKREQALQPHKKKPNRDMEL